MKHNDIFSALSFADDELTERAHKTMQGEHKYKKIAASILLLAAIWS